MKRFIALLAMIFALTSCFCLAACKAEVASPKSDVEEMNEIISGKAPFYVLLVGNDTRQGTIEDTGEYYVYSDTMMLAYVEPLHYKVSLVSIPRDTESTVNGSPAKINSAYTTEGIEGTIDQIESLTGVKISYYANLSFVSFAQLVDALGGVTAVVPFDMSLKDIVGGGKITLSAGEQELNGSEALVLARMRKDYNESGEACRQMASREMVQNLILSVAGNPNNVEACVNAFLAVCDTNIDKEKLLELALDYAANADQITITTCTGPYEAYEMPQYDGQVMVPRDEDLWARVIAAIESGRNPNSVVAPPVPEPIEE